MEAKPKNKVLVVVGPSGVGKDTLMLKLFEKYPNVFKKGTTHTSRQIRPGEVDGENYHYVTKEAFLDLKDKNGFVETNFYNNNYYGLSKMELEKAEKMNKIMYVIIDINGAYSVHNLKIPANYIAFLPPSIETLEKRLTGRGTEKQDVIAGRIKIAKDEVKRIQETKFFNYKIINDDMNKALKELEDKMKILYPQFLKK
jgi:guanylate kinase